MIDDAPLVTVNVTGEPVPQGSKRIGRAGGRSSGRPILIDDNAAELEPWRGAVAWKASAAWRRRPPLDEPLAVVVSFTLPRPPSVRSRVWPYVKPDLDKLVRAVFDGMTEGGVWRDDSRVCRLTTEKSYGEPGCTIAVYRLLDDEATA